MTRRELIRRLALWLVTGFLLTLLVGIIASLITHHGGQDAARIAGAAYVVLSAIVFVIVTLRRRSGRTRTRVPVG